MGFEKEIIDWFEDAKDYFEDDEIKYVEFLLQRIRREGYVRRWAYLGAGLILGAAITGALIAIF